MSDLKPGQCVLVNDEGLNMLRKLMARMGEEVKPNHIGRISYDPWDDPETYLVEFPIGDDPIEEHSQAATYPKELVFAIGAEHPLFEYWKRL